MTDFIKPMLAKPLPKDFDPQHTEVYVEPKFDGHRHLVRVQGGGKVVAWSSRMIDALHKMDLDLIREMANWPRGIYDGELHLGPGESSSDVAKLVNRSKLQYTIFDILELRGKSLLSYTWRDRVYELANARSFSRRVEVAMHRRCPNRQVYAEHGQRGMGTRRRRTDA